MANPPVILGPDGIPVRRHVLTEEIAVPNGTGVRSIISGHPAQGLTPSRLGALLREAEYGDPLRYLELAEEMEEKDPHYSGVMGTRKRAVSGLDVNVTAASDDRVDQENADLVRQALERDELRDELFDILDAVGKGFSNTEIIWETSERQWMPVRFEWRDPRWFTFNRTDGRTMLLRTEGGDEPLPAFKFICHRVKAKSGLPVRGGIARLVAWYYLFKNYGVKDWISFAETYGQPMRVGKYGPDAKKEDKEVLLRALRSLGVDWAAMIPESMMVELIESKITGNVDLFERMADWLDRQVSKAVLGQTATTDAIQGGYAVGRVHDEVRQDILEADAANLGATLTRDVAMPVVQLNRGPQERYPRIEIRVPASVDVAALSGALKDLVPLGLKVSKREVMDKLGLAEPSEDDELLEAPAASKPGRLPVKFDQVREAQAMMRALAAAGDGDDRDLIEDAAAALLEAEGWEDAMTGLVVPIRQALDGAGSYDEARERLRGVFAAMEFDGLTDMLARGLFHAHLAGEADEPLADDEV